MDLTEAMKALEAAGTEQNRKIYGRHGYPANTYGVSHAVLGQMQKKIKRDQALASALWRTGNGDAMILATMIGDPETVTAKELDSWVASIPGYAHSNMLARFAAQTPHAAKLSQKWMKSKTDLVSQCGWDLVAHAAMNPDRPDSEFEPLLAAIEKGIHAAPNWTRRAMNGALIAIGGRNAKLGKLAIAAAGRIGKVYVDHGETSCKTPDAAEYIKKIAARRK